MPVLVCPPSIRLSPSSTAPYPHELPAYAMNEMENQVPEETASPATPVDKLWNYQLRKENKVIYDGLAETQKQQEALAVESNRKIQDLSEKVADFAHQVARYEEDRKKNERLIEEQKKDMENFMDGMRSFLQGRFSDDKIEMIMSGGAYFNEASQSPCTGIEATTVTGTPTIASLPAAPSPPHAIAPSHECRSPDPPPHQKIVLHKRKSRIATETSRRGPTKGRAPQRRPCGTSHQKASRSSEASVGEPAKSHQPSQYFGGDSALRTLPKLNQNHLGMMAYFERASKRFVALENAEAFENNFITAFIAGIRERHHREKLVNELSMRHRFRINEDQAYEVQCEWEDIKEGLVRAGFVASRKRGRDTELSSRLA